MVGRNQWQSEVLVDVAIITQITVFQGTKSDISYRNRPQSGSSGGNGSRGGRHSVSLVGAVRVTAGGTGGGDAAALEGRVNFADNEGGSFGVSVGHRSGTVQV